MKVSDKILFIWIIFIGIGEVANVFGSFLGKSFDDCYKIYCLLNMFLAIAVIVYGLITIINKKRKKNEMASKEVKCSQFDKEFAFMVAIIFGLFVGYVFYVISFGRVLLQGNLDMELANTIISSNSFYKVNPMTGSEYMIGVPNRIKLLCLPAIYAFAARLLHLPVRDICLVIIPITGAVLSMLAYTSVSNVLFMENAWKKKAMFIIAVMLVLFFSGYCQGIEGFGLLFSVWRGSYIRMGVLFPFSLSLTLRKKWFFVLACVVCEACICWTLYGIGICAVSAIILSVSTLLVRRVQNDRVN